MPGIALSGTYIVPGTGCVIVYRVCMYEYVCNATCPNTHTPSMRRRHAHRTPHREALARTNDDDDDDDDDTRSWKHALISVSVAASRRIA